MNQTLMIAQQGYKECYAVLKEHGKTFYFMARLMNAEQGKAIAALYFFARSADDVVDSASSSTTKTTILNQLTLMKHELNKALAQQSRDSRYMVLADAINKYQIALFPFDDLLAGVTSDLTKNRFANFTELKHYCYQVAGTIGLMITPVAGFKKNSMALEYAKTLGTAFQLTNILRDVGADLKLNRIYLPQDELQKFAISESDLLAHKVDEQFKLFMTYQINRAQKLYEEGLPLIALLNSFAAKLAFQFAIDAYSAILNKIIANQYDVFNKRAHLTFFEKLIMIPASALRAYKAKY